MPVRVVLAVVAVAAVAWLAVLLRDARLVDDPAAAARSGVGRTAAARSADRLDRAGLLNPDGGLDVDRARFELLAGRPRVALRTARAAVRREPDNVQAWVALWSAAGALRDRATAVRAVAEIRRLDPFAGRTG